MSRCKHKDAIAILNFPFFRWKFGKRCNVETGHNRNFCDRHIDDYKYPSRKPKRPIQIPEPSKFLILDKTVNGTGCNEDADILRNVLP